MGGEAAGADALRAAVRERAERRVDVVKIMASGGVNTAGSDAAAPQFGVDDLRVVVKEAHRLGLPVTAHAHSVGSVRDAIDAGVDAIEHATFVTETGFAPDPTAVTDLAARRIPVCPTLGFVPGATPPPAGPRDDAAHRHDDGEPGGDVRRPAPRRGAAGGRLRRRHQPREAARCAARGLVQLAQAGVPVVDVLASATSRRR